MYYEAIHRCYTPTYNWLNAHPVDLSSTDMFGQTSLPLEAGKTHLFSEKVHKNMRGWACKLKTSQN